MKIFFFGHYLILRRKLDVCGGEDHIFFGLYLILRGKLKVCGREDFFFALYLTFGVILDVNFHLLIENITLVCLDYYVDYYFSNLYYFR